jgi:hypothetical protein
MGFIQANKQSVQRIQSLVLSQGFLFGLIIAVNSVLMLLVKYYPSMDGPAHLYNSALLPELLFGDNPDLNNYFQISTFPMANWMALFILSFFNLFLPAWMAEKILLLFYLIGISYAFRYLVKQINPEGLGLSFIIFPFIYSFLFHLGFYNYSLSFVMLFFILGFWIKHQAFVSVRVFVLLFFFMGLLYFSALLSFLFAGLSMGLFTLAYFIGKFSFGENKRKIFKEIIARLLFLLLASLPWLILIIWFIAKTDFLSTGYQYSINELVKWINDVRCLIVYDYPGDEKLTQQILHILLAFTSISLFLRFSTAKKKWLQLNDIFLIPLALAILLFFMIPDGSGAGMMSHRYCLMIYMLFIIWFASLKMPLKTIRVFVVLIIGFHLGLLFKHYNGAIRDLNKNAVAIEKAEVFIKKNSMVLPVNLSRGWIEPHFSNYLGLDKPLIILQNYQATLSWFPVQWNHKNLPDISLGELREINHFIWPSNPSSSIKRQIDYVFLYGELSDMLNPEWSTLLKELESGYWLIYTSPDNYVKLYRASMK